MARGGRRQGAPGAQYGNRQDLQQGQRKQPVARIPGQDQGVQAEQIRSQQALPVTTAPMPQQLTQPVPLSAPTQRPNEPLTAGVDIGAGPGSSPLALPADDGDPTIGELRALYMAFPSEDLRELLEDYDASRD